MAEDARPRDGDGPAPPRPPARTPAGRRRGRGRGRGLPGWLGVAGQGVAALVGLALLAAAGGLLLLTQTSAGRQATAGILEDALAGTLSGRVEIGPVVGGNLFTRVELGRFRILAPDGQPFLEMRDVRVEYSPVGFLTGDYHLRRVRTGRMELHLRQDTAGVWNHEVIFEEARSARRREQEAAADEEDGDGTRLIVTDALVEDGLVEVRTPWEDGAGARRRPRGRRTTTGGGEDDVVWNLEPGPHGVQRVIRLEELAGRFPFLRLADPLAPMHLELQEVSATARAVRQPLRIDALTGAVTFDDTIRLELPELNTAASRLSGDGRVVPEDQPRFRFDLEAERLAFGELQWLPVPVPREGGGSGDLVVRTAENPETLVVEVASGDFRSGDSRVTGGFVLAMPEDATRFEEMDLRLRPVRLGLVHDLLDQPGRPDGYVEGTVSGSGPLELVRIDADVELRPPPGSAAAAGGAADADTASASGLEARGGIGLVGEPRAFRDLELRFLDFRPRWTHLIGIDTRQQGRVNGTATLDRTPGGRVAFTADLRHRLPGDSTSHLTGRGSFEADETTRVDVSLTADPVSLSLLDPYFPQLDMVGVVRGPLSATGHMGDLEARADLETPRGAIEFDGRFDLVAERKRYDARLTARGIQLQQWFREGPSTRLDVRGRVEGAGTDPATLDATFDLEVLPSRVEGAAVDSSLLRFTVEEGLARVDTFAIRSDVGTVRGTGGFGLAADRSGALYLDVTAPHLSRWNRWLVEGRAPVGPDTTAQDLFALFPRRADEGAGEEAEEAAAPPDTLSGSLTARGVIYGTLENFGLGGSLSARRAGYGEATADSLAVVLDATTARSLDSLVLTGQAWQLGYQGQSVDSATVRFTRRGARLADVELRARRPGGAVAAAGRLEWGDVRTAVQLDELRIQMGTRRLTLPEPTSVAYGDSGLVVRSFVLEGGGGGRVRADGEIPRSGTARFDLQIENLALGELGRMVRLETPVSGRLDGSVQVRGRARAPEMEATVTVDTPGVASLNYDRFRAALEYRDRRLSGEAELRSGQRQLALLTGGVAVDLSFNEVGDRWLQDPLDLRLVTERLPLALLLAPTDALDDVRGYAAVDVRIGGSLESLSLDGEGRVAEGYAWVLPLNVHLQNIRGGLRFRGSEMQVDSLAFASTVGGTGSVSGSVDLATPTDPAFDLTLTGRKLHGIDRRRVTMVIDGRGHLGGSYRSPTVTGKYRLSDGTMRLEEFMRQDEVVDLTDPELYALLDTTALAEQRLLSRVRNPFMQNLRADLALTIGPDLWLRSPDLNVELAGNVDLRLDRAEGDVTLFGEVKLLRGTYRWSPRGGLISRQLTITGGTIAFVGTPGVNPNLDLTAVHRVRSEEGTIIVRTNITGTMLNPQVALTSEPPMPESDRICVLLTNSPCATALSAQLATDLLVGRVGTELTSLLAGGSGLPDYVTLQTAGGTAGEQAGLGNGNQNESFLAQKELEVGWYLSPELFLTLTQPLGGRPPSGALEWRFSEAWVMELRSQLRFGQEFGSTASNLETDRLWGMFLFREWSF